MKKVLCYGDSNTFGFDATTLDRYAKNERWSGVIGEILAKENFEVIEEGLNDRNGFVKNAKGYEYCSFEHLPVCLKQHPDIDLIILAVGTNDLQFAYNFDEKVLTDGLNKLVDIVKENIPSCKIIIVPPVKLDKYVVSGYFGYQFDETSVTRSDSTFELYEKFAQENNCGYFDFNKIARPSNKDGLHYEPDTHRLIAQKLAKYITSFFN